MLLVLGVVLALAGCRQDPPPLTADVPLHLEDHLDDAVITGSEVPSDVPAAVEWRFDEPQPEWKTIVPPPPDVRPATLTRTADALRITLTEDTDYKDGDNRPELGGGIYIDLPDWRREEWGDILIRDRTSQKIEGVLIGFNLRRKIGTGPWQRYPLLFHSDNVPVIRDGTEQTYVMRADWSMDGRGQRWEGPWRELAVVFLSREPASIDVLSVSVVPKEARFAGAPLGVKTEARDQAYRRTLYTHAPSKLEYRVRVPAAGRLDVGLGVLRDDVPVTFRVTARPDGQAAEHLLQESYSDQEHWGQRSVDLAHLGGKEVTLTLATEAEHAGTLALWAAPTLSGARATNKPNVIFYIIDGGGADYMSVYGYNRRTTPNMETLAAEGALFEHAYSNSDWTRPSTLSFLTGLQHSAMGGMKNNRNTPPEGVLTIQEHLHNAGYQTALFTSNPNAGTMSSLDRGVDVLRERGVNPPSHSTKELHTDFWKWRNEYAGEPYWVHFQTTDVHAPHNPPEPFAGLYISPERRKTLDQWTRKLGLTNYWPSLSDLWDGVFEKAGLDRIAFYNARRDLYTECMAHQDYQIGRLVDRLKARGEWGNTLLIIASDHGVVAGSDDFGTFARESLPPRWNLSPMFRPGTNRIPMIFVWPGRIIPGQRFSDPVSMIDMLPTILDLVRLPQPEVKQGQSLAPLLLDKAGWEPRPVILDKFKEDANTGRLRGFIEVVDGRWGASLEINPDPERRAERKRPVPLLLYDLWNDPYCLKSLHEARPDLVRKYTEFLEAQFEAHQALAQRFTRSEDSPLTPEQLRTLRSLGYIQ